MSKHPRNFKAGYITIIGYPNAGKSTLLNRLLDFKLSITSPKPQTTRRKVMGIMNKENLQVIFLDTPGILQPKYYLQKVMMNTIQGAILDADALIFIIDIMNYPSNDKDIEQQIDFLHSINRTNKPVILLLNKIDTCDKNVLLPVIKIYNLMYKFKAIIPISALKGDGLDKLEVELYNIIPEHAPYYDTDILSEQPERFFVSELIREQIFFKYKKEIPYSCEVIIDQFKERETGKYFISALIYTERQSQKAILIGKNGNALKEIGIKARSKIENFLDKQVFLELRVKTSKDWRKNEKKIKRFGY